MSGETNVKFFIVGREIHSFVSTARSYSEERAVQKFFGRFVAKIAFYIPHLLSTDATLYPAFKIFQGPRLVNKVPNKRGPHAKFLKNSKRGPPLIRDGRVVEISKNDHEIRSKWLSDAYRFDSF